MVDAKSGNPALKQAAKISADAIEEAMMAEREEEEAINARNWTPDMPQPNAPEPKIGSYERFIGGL